MAKRINARLRDVMLKAGIDQKTLAEESGVSRQYISLHIGGHWNLSEEEEVKIAKVLRRHPV